VLGRLVPQYFLGGQMQIFPERAFTAITQLGKSINLNPIQTAFGVIEVVNAQMERAIRVISVERGHDPRDFILFSFGGAGGLHAVELARHLGIPTVIISKVASTLSAYGMLASNIVKDYMQTVMLSGNSSHKKLMKLFAPIEGRGVSEVKKEGINGGQIEIVRSMDIRYIGQSYELSIPYSKDYISEFHRTHHASYGYSFIEKPLEIVNLRVRVIGKVSPIKLPLISMALQSFNPLPMETKQVEMNSGTTSIPVFNIAQLKPSTRLEGPALIVSSDTTILIFKNDIIMVDRYQNLLIDVGVID
jgi:N-methylhydantoinase A